MIRELRNEEIDQIMKIWLEENLSAHHFIDANYWKLNYQNVISNYLPKSKTYVYSKDSLIVGFISIMYDDFIGALFVSDEYQNQGIGTELIDFVKQNQKMLNVSVYVDNKNAVQFYQAKGFEIKVENEERQTGAMEYFMFWKQQE